MQCGTAVLNVDFFFFFFIHREALIGELGILNTLKILFAVFADWNYTFKANFMKNIASNLLSHILDEGDRLCVYVCDTTPCLTLSSSWYLVRRWTGFNR